MRNLLLVSQLVRRLLLVSVFGEFLLLLPFVKRATMESTRKYFLQLFLLVYNNSIFRCFFTLTRSFVLAPAFIKLSWAAHLALLHDIPKFIVFNVHFQPLFSHRLAAERCNKKYVAESMVGDAASKMFSRFSVLLRFENSLLCLRLVLV